MNKLTRRCKPRVSIAALWMRSLLYSYASQGYAPNEARRHAMADFHAPLPF